MAKYIETKSIPVDQIELAPNHPRKTFEDIEKIGQSIKEKGQMQPICVRPKNERFELAFGARRLKGCQLKGIPEVRVEIWDMDDSELEFWQLREIYHTASLKTDPEADEAYRNKFHKTVEEKIDFCKLQKSSLCPQCYDCTKYPGGGKEGCPAFLSQTKFAEMIGSEIDQSNIWRAIRRATIRGTIPELKDLKNLPAPSVSLLLFLSFYKENLLTKDEIIALATKAADGKLGDITKEQRGEAHGYGTPYRTLEVIRDYLRKGIPEEIKRKLISKPLYGPLSAESEMMTGSTSKEVIGGPTKDLSSVSTKELTKEIVSRLPESMKPLAKPLEFNKSPIKLTGDALNLMLDYQHLENCVKGISLESQKLMPENAQTALYMKGREVAEVIIVFNTKFPINSTILIKGGKNSEQTAR